MDLAYPDRIQAVRDFLDLCMRTRLIPPIALFENRKGCLVDVTETLFPDFYQKTMTEHCRLVQNELGLQHVCLDEQCRMAGMSANGIGVADSEFDGLCYAGMHNRAVHIRDGKILRAVFLIGQMRLHEDDQHEVLKNHANAIAQGRKLGKGDKHVTQRIRNALYNQGMYEYTKEDLDEIVPLLRSLGQFIYNLGHENMAIRYYSSFFSKLVHEKLSSTQKHIEGIVKKAGGTSDDLTEVQKAFSPLMSSLGYMEYANTYYAFQQCIIWDLLREVKQVCMKTAKSKEIDIKIRCEGNAMSDKSTEVQAFLSRKHLVSAFFILLENALRFSASGEHLPSAKKQVHMTLRLGTKEEGYSVSFEDIGEYIPPERIQKGELFGYNADRHTSDGLFYAQEVIEAHKGEIAVTSTMIDSARSLARTIFTVRLPYEGGESK